MQIFTPLRQFRRGEVGRASLVGGSVHTLSASSQTRRCASSVKVLSCDSFAPRLATRSGAHVLVHRVLHYVGEPQGRQEHAAPELINARWPRGRTRRSSTRQAARPRLAPDQRRARSLVLTAACRELFDVDASDQRRINQGPRGRLLPSSTHRVASWEPGAVRRGTLSAMSARAAPVPQAHGWQ